MNEDKLKRANKIKEEIEAELGYKIKLKDKID